MKTIIYCIYFAGVGIWGLCLLYLEAIPAIVTTLLAPFLILHIAEMTGRVRIQSAPKPTTPIELATYHGLSDEEALNKFGWSLIVEMDKCIEETKTQLETMQKSREEMAAMHRKETK